MAQASCPSQSRSNIPTKVQIELDETVLARLFMQGHLCAADINCLNLTSKQAIWQLCLQACGQCIEHSELTRPAWEALPRLNKAQLKSTSSDS